jgi:hypothetical protein
MPKYLTSVGYNNRMNEYEEFIFHVGTEIDTIDEAIIKGQALVPEGGTIVIYLHPGKRNNSATIYDWFGPVAPTHNINMVGLGGSYTERQVRVRLQDTTLEANTEGLMLALENVSFTTLAGGASSQINIEAGWSLQAINCNCGATTYRADLAAFVAASGNSINMEFYDCKFVNPTKFIGTNDPAAAPIEYPLFIAFVNTVLGASKQTGEHIFDFAGDGGPDNGARVLMNILGSNLTLFDTSTEDPPSAIFGFNGLELVPTIAENQLTFENSDIILSAEGTTPARSTDAVLFSALGVSSGPYVHWVDSEISFETRAGGAANPTSFDIGTRTNSDPILTLFGYPNLTRGGFPYITGGYFPNDPDTGMRGFDRLNLQGSGGDEVWWNGGAWVP